MSLLQKSNFVIAMSSTNPMHAVRKDPRGGLTAAGRKYYAEKEGAHLRPGVKKAERDMTPEDMRRKGSFLRRHYGRKNPFRLLDEKGQPTRYALQAHAWGERVPKTPEDIQRLAEKGHKLLEKAERAERKADASTGKASNRRTTGESSSTRRSSRLEPPTARTTRTNRTTRASRASTVRV